MGGATAAWWRRFIPPARDAALALVVTVALLYGAYGEAHPSTTAYFHGGHHLPRTPAAAFILVGVACLVLAWRRRWPVAVLGVSVAAATTFTLLGYLNGAVLVAPMIALYTVASFTSIRRAVGYGIATLVVLGSASIAVNPLGRFGGGVVILPFMVAVMVVAGIAVANRRAYVDSIRDRAEQDARRRIDEERLRIARELHDAIGHHLSALSINLEVAGLGLERGAAEVRAPLDKARLLTRTMLSEVRNVVGRLRREEATDLAAALKSLAAAIPSPVIHLSLPEALPPVDAERAQAILRCAQECVTNAIRHSSARNLWIELDASGGGLGLRVRDDGRGAPNLAEGSGLSGMRDRLSALQGRLRLAPGPPGFEAHVWLP